MSQEQMKRILVVDDDPVQVKLLGETLKKRGFDVTTTTEAADGLQKAMLNHPDLIILAVMMPVINGYNFCKLLKDQPDRKHIPIILLTSRDNIEDVKIGLKMGANAYLTKPVNMEELLKTIHMVSSMTSKDG